MSQTKQVRRVVIIADTAIERLLLEHIMSVGARGYNCVYCFGKGRHEPIDDPFTGRSRVRIEVLAKPSVATAIMDFVHQHDLQSYPITAFFDTVEVDSRDTNF
jgi:hypothetical protein